MDIEERFKRSRGRLPTRLERKRYERLRNNFEIKDNDAIWTVVDVLEFYDSVYRQYPDQVSDVVRSELRRGNLPSGSVPGMVSQIQLVSLAGFAFAHSLLVGAAGVAIGSRTQQLSTPDGSTLEVVRLATARVLNAPAGWAVGCVLLVPAVYGGLWAWQRAHDQTYSSRGRALGWFTLAGLVMSTCSWLLLLIG